MELAAEAAPLVVMGSRSRRVDVACTAAKSARPPVRRAPGWAALRCLRWLAQGAEVATDLLWLGPQRDEPDSREMIADTLRAAGGVVTATASGDEALLCLQTSSLDLFICDLGMPLKDGYSVVRELCSSARAAVPAIALSAYASTSDVEKAIASGFQMHVAKPIEPRQLLDAIAALVTRP